MVPVALCDANVGDAAHTQGIQTVRYPCKFVRLVDGRWSSHYVGGDLGDVRVVASTREEAFVKIRNELRYRLELCPCSGDMYQHLEIEVVEKDANA